MPLLLQLIEQLHVLLYLSRKRRRLHVAFGIKIILQYHPAMKVDIVQRQRSTKEWLKHSQL